MVNKNNTPKSFYTVKEVADRLGVSRVTVFKRIQKGQIKAEKMGRNYIVHAHDVPTLAKGLNEDIKKEITHGVKKVIRQYGETLQLLGRE